MTTPDWVANLTVPEDDRDAFATLTNLSEENAKVAVTALENLSVDDGEKGVAAALSKAGVEDSDYVAQALFSFSVFRVSNNLPADEAADALARSLRESGKNIGGVNLTGFLAAVGLVAVAKVYDLSRAYPIRYFGGRIITELRPVFDELAEEVSGAIVVHQLVLEAWQDDDLSDRILTMNDRDLDLLAQQIERAKKKSRTLRRLTDSSGITIYGKPVAAGKEVRNGD